MAIDDPIEAFEQQYMRDEPEVPKALAKVAAKLGFPDGGFGLELLVGVSESLFDTISTEERIKALWELLKAEIKNLKTTKLDHNDAIRAATLVFWYDRQQRDNAKRERFVKLIGNALRSEEQVKDLTSFVQTLEQLNERDVIVLRALNTVMNKEGDWKVQANPGGDVRKVHPNTFTQRSQELAVQVAEKLGQRTEGNVFSREEGYGVCNRLQGFGLAHYIDTQPRELPVTNYCFRPSVLGLQLLKLLGENVPNYEYYVRA